MKTMFSAGKVLLLVAAAALCSAPRTAGASDLEVLQEVQDALNHADMSLDALGDLISEVMPTNEPNATTTATTKTSTTSTTPKPATTTTTPPPPTTTPPPPTTTTTTPPPPTTTPPPPTTTTTTPPPPTTTLPPPTTTTTTPPPPTTTPPPPTTTPPPPTTTAKPTTTTTPQPATTTSSITTPEPTNPVFSNLATSDVLRVAGVGGPWNYRRIITNRNSGDRSPHRRAARDVLSTPLRVLSLGTRRKSHNQLSIKNTDSTTKQSSVTTRDSRAATTMITTEPPWWARVNMHLKNMGSLTEDISEGKVDSDHAQWLDQEAEAIYTLVKEGENDTSVVTEEGLEWQLYQNVEESLRNATDYVDERIAKAEADYTEMVVTIVLLSVLFVVVLTGIVVALIRPGSRKSGLSKSKSYKEPEGQEVPEDEGRTFPDAKFVQHMHLHMDPYRRHTTDM